MVNIVGAQYIAPAQQKNNMVSYCVLHSGIHSHCGRNILRPYNNPPF